MVFLYQASLDTEKGIKQDFVLSITGNLFWDFQPLPAISETVNPQLLSTWNKIKKEQILITSSGDLSVSTYKSEWKADLHYEKHGPSFGLDQSIL